MALRTCTPRLTHLAVCLLLCSLTNLAGAQQPKPHDEGKKTYGTVETKTYDFKEAGKEMEYALFVPTTYHKDKKTPLIVALHGLGSDPQQIIKSKGLTEQAEKHGYIVVAPMGYNNSGWYGVGTQGEAGGLARPGGLPGLGRQGGLPGLGTPPGTVLSPRVQESLKLTDEQKKKLQVLQKDVDTQLEKILTDEQSKQMKDLQGNAGRGFGRGPDAQANTRELSEKDVLNVLNLVRKDFTIDEKRIYLLGHSMGGAGAWHLGTKYPDLWAGLAPIAPATVGQPTGLEKLKQIPVIVVQGDQDRAERLETTRRWVAKVKELNLTHEYLEVAGAGHIDVVSKGMPKIFEFFEQHKKEDKGK
jgi:poly(3-hydroxybutyrate) depolymerase